MGINLKNLEKGYNIWSFDILSSSEGSNKLSWKTDPENSTEPQRIYFMIDGNIKWEINKNYFSKKGTSSPHLKVELDNKLDIVFHLSNAMFPGTAISADFVFQLNPGKKSKIEFTSFLDKHKKLIFEVDMIKWLTGNETAVSNINFNGYDKICDYGLKRSQNGRESYEGNVQIKKMDIQFLPNWQFNFKKNNSNPANLPIRVNVNSYADDIGMQDDSGQQLVFSDDLQIFLLLPNDNSLNIDPKPKRTLLRIPRNKVSWSNKRVFPAIAKFPIGTEPDITKLQQGNDRFIFSKIESDDEMFDYIFIELGIDDTTPHDDDRKNIKQETMLACSNQEGKRGKIIFTPNFGSDPEIMPENSKSDPFSLSFNKPSFIVDYVQRESCLVTGFCPNDQLLLIDQYAFKISNNIKTASYKLLHTFKDDTSIALTDESDVANRNICFFCEMPVDVIITKVDNDIQLSPICKQNQKLTIMGKNGQFSNCDWISNNIIEGVHLSFPIIQLDVSRYKDLLSLRYEFKEFNFEAILGKVPKLIANDPLKSILKIKFCSPQHIAEKTFTRPDGMNDNPPISSYAAGTSQLVFKFPNNNPQNIAKNYIEFSADGLLTWDKFDPVIDEKASISKSLECENNDYQDDSPNDITLIECPWKLFISPTENETWKNSWTGKKTTITKQQSEEEGLPTYYELWHSRLDLREKTAIRGLQSFEQEYKMKITALGCDDDEGNFPTTLTNQQRKDIVHWSGVEHIQVNKLILSTLGAWMDVYGDWEDGGIIWIHRTTMGRDVFSQYVRRGKFTPFGFLGEYIEKTVRVIENKNGRSISYLFKDFILNILDPKVDYTQYNDRSFPFKSMVLEGEKSYKIINPGSKVSFYPATAAGDINFKILGIDVNGNRCSFTIPMIFTTSEDDDDLQDAINQYRRSTPEKRTAKLNGQTLCYVKEKPSTLNNSANFIENTSFPTFNLAFDVRDTPDNNMPLPILDSEKAASVSFPSIEDITGKEIKRTIKYYKNYLTKGFTDSGNSLYLQLVNPISIKFSEANEADKAGGLATPDLNIHAMSTSFGPINAVINNGDNTEDEDKILEILENFDEGNFDPTKFFGKDAKLLGYFNLFDIIEPITHNGQNQEFKIPSLKTTIEDEKVVSTYDWEPQLKITDKKFSGLGIQLKKFEDVKPELEPKLKIILRVEKKIGSSDEDPLVKVKGTMNNFGISFLEFLTVNIEQLEFNSSSGNKMDLQVKFKSPDDKKNPLIKFENEMLKMLDDLKNSLPSDSFDNGARITPSSSGIDIGYTIPIPDINMGALNIFNIVMDTSLSLYFDNQPPKLGFSFGRTESPFLVNVSVYAGGGYFNIVTSENGIEKLDAYICFGGGSQMNISGIAKGSIWLFAYIQVYKEITDVGSQISITAGLKASGTLDVLGLVIVSVLFDMGLTYVNNTLTGSATVEVKVKVMFVKKRKKLKMDREFKVRSDSSSISNDEKLLFKNMMNSNDWMHYSMAFA